MEFVTNMPFDSVLGDDTLSVALWKSDKNVCEYSKDSTNCDTSGLYYGTDDVDEPKFCARHFYMNIVSGNGKSNYALKDC